MNAAHLEAGPAVRVAGGVARLARPLPQPRAVAQGHHIVVHLNNIICAKIRQRLRRGRKKIINTVMITHIASQIPVRA